MLNLFWFRRDLRLRDNAGLYHALRSGKSVQAIFIFDTSILDKLDDKQDRRVSFIYQNIASMKKELEEMGSTLDVRHGNPTEIWPQILADYQVDTIFTNHDYEPYAAQRDEAIKKLLQSQNVDFKTFKDHVIFEKDELVSGKGTPYTIFTPYANAWRKRLAPQDYAPYDTETYFSHFYKTQAKPLLALSSMGFVDCDDNMPALAVTDELLKRYADMRDFPAQNGTSRLSVHLRFGTVSIRALVAKSLNLSATWLNELIWRDFYMMILFNFPHVAQRSFKPAYDRIVWRNNVEEFERWCEGKTGYPIVDAGMRELNETGFMHNRVRMITASFLVKHLLIDWRWGEAYFAQKLIDFELSSNNGGWQWAASSGCDAAPYFRVFNPSLQAQKFDSQGIYIRKWVKEFNTLSYVHPIVVHEQARERVLKAYKSALGGDE